jgi:hypothetical protein
MKSLLYQGASRAERIKVAGAFGGISERVYAIAHRTGEFGFVLPRRAEQKG